MMTLLNPGWHELDHDAQEAVQKVIDQAIAERRDIGEPFRDGDVYAHHRGRWIEWEVSSAGRSIARGMRNIDTDEELDRDGVAVT